MSDVKALMENKPLHWTELASCVGDDRFTYRQDLLSISDIGQMARMCLFCPVYDDCLDWAERERVTDVFAAAMSYGVQP